MKRSISIFTLSLLIILVACNKNDINNTSDRVGISRVVFFPAIKTNGQRLIIINQGATFTDPGATATLNGVATPFTVNTVNTNVPGVYDLTYTATNPQGFTATDWRTVVVIGNDVTTHDYSGRYLRAATGVISTWTKTASGQYIVDNPGGAAVGAGYKVVVVNYTGNKIKIPHQIAVDPTTGSVEVSSTSETFNDTAVPITYSWIFLAPGYGTGLRTFTKQ